MHAKKKNKHMIAYIVLKMLKVEARGARCMLLVQFSRREPFKTYSYDWVQNCRIIDETTSSSEVDWIKQCMKKACENKI